MCDIDDAVLRQCPYGYVFAVRVVRYFNQLLWDLTLPPVSFLELYFDFCLDSGTVAPILMRPSTGVLKKDAPFFALPDQDIKADANQVPLVVQSRTWARMIKWLLHQWSDCPLTIHNRVKSVSACGYCMPAISLGGGPKFLTGVRPKQSLWTYFHPNGFAKQNMARMWRPSCPVNHQVFAQAGA